MPICALRIGEAHPPEVVLFIKIALHRFELLLFGNLVQFFFDLLNFFRGSFLVPLKIHSLRKAHFGKQLSDFLIADAFVGFVKESQVLVQSGHELRQ